MSYFGFTSGFSDKLLGDYIEGKSLALAIPGTSAIDAEHFAVQMVGVAAVMTVPVEEIGELEGEGGVRDDLVSLMIAERLQERARKHPPLRAALNEQIERIHVRVAQSPVATAAIWYADLYSDLAWSFSKRGEHERALGLARRAVAHAHALDGGQNLFSHLRDLARHTFVAQPDEGARLWVKVLEHDPTNVWTYVQLGHLGADVGLPELAHHARLRGLHVIRERKDEDTRSVREQLEREAGEKIEARPVAISASALADLHRALDGTSTPSGSTDVELMHELVPDLASVPVKRRPTAADIPDRARVLGALGKASHQPRSPDELVMDLHSFGRPSPQPQVRSGPKVGRNDPCPCGSGRKWKKCCGAAAGT